MDRSIPELAKSLLLSRPELEILSLDVFDTIICRPYKKPVDLFLDLHRQAKESGLVPDGIGKGLFRDTRIQAEEYARREAYKETGRTEITLTDIYAKFPLQYGRDDLQAILEMELALEAECLAPVPGVSGLVKAAKDAGKKVVLVSDTYFTQEQILHFIGKEIGPEFIDRVFCSNDYGLAKHQGLFSVVLKELGVEGKKILHMGDNPHADIHPPREVGIQAIQLPKFSDLEYDVDIREQSLLKAFSRSDEPVVTGYADFFRSRALQAAGNNVAYGKNPKAFGRRLGISWLGLPIMAYLDALKTRSEQAGATVCFITREATVLGSWYRRLHADTSGRSNPVELEISRATLFPYYLIKPSLENYTTFFLTRRSKLSPRLFFDFLGLSAADEKLDFDINKSLENEQDVAEFYAALSAQKERLGDISERAESLLSQLKGYIDEQFLVAGGSKRKSGKGRVPNKILVADVGWSGSTVNLFRKVLQHLYGDVGVMACLFAVDERVLKTQFRGEIDVTGFLFMGEKDAIARLALRNKEFTEQCCIPPGIGSTVGFDESNSPIRSTAVKQAANSRDLLEGIRLGVEDIIDVCHSVEGSVSRKALGQSKEFLRCIYARPFVLPLGDELVAIREVSHDENNGSERFEQIGIENKFDAFKFAEFEQIHNGEAYWPLGDIAVHRHALSERYIYSSLYDHDDPRALHNLIYTGRDIVEADIVAHCDAVSNPSVHSVSRIVWESDGRSCQSIAARFNHSLSLRASLRWGSWRVCQWNISMRDRQGRSAYGSVRADRPSKATDPIFELLQVEKLTSCPRTWELVIRANDHVDDNLIIKVDALLERIY